MSAKPRLTLAAVGLFLAASVAPPSADATSAAATFAAASGAVLQDAASIMSTMQAKQNERWEGVENYTIVKSLEVAGGMQTPQYFERMTTDSGQTVFRLVPPPVYEREMLARAGFPPPSAQGYRDMATGYEMLGSALETGGGDQPPMPGASAMMGDMAMFLRAGADAVENLDDGSADAAQRAADMRMFAERARLDGREAVTATSSGTTREAFKLVADGLGLVQEADGGKFTLNTATVWIDTEHYVPLRLKMDGEVENDGRPQDITIEKANLDYRQVGPLYEPYREVAKISGIMAAMSDEQREEMERAKEQLAEAKRQLESLPEAQREMAKRMMGGQIEKFEKMVEGEAFETSLNVESIAVNEGPPTPYGIGDLQAGSTTFPAAMTIAAEDGVAELSIIARSGDVQASIKLVGSGPFPAEGGTVTIGGGDGSVDGPGDEKKYFDEASGTITVVVRTDTRIAGAFTGNLTNSEGGAMAISGQFDSGAPMGPYQAPRGSPIPAMFGSE